MAEIQTTGLSASAIKLDVADETEVDAAFVGIAAAFGRLDILVNNAAVLIGGPFADMAMSDWDQVMAVNLRGAALCARRAFRLMGEHGGSIVNVSSLGGVPGTESSRLRRLHRQQVRPDRFDRGAGGGRPGAQHPGQRRGAGRGGHRHAASGRAAPAHPHRSRRCGQGDRFLCDPSESGCMTGATLTINSNL